MEGSVDEESTKSDEEYDDLAMRDGLEDGYWTDDEDEFSRIVSVSGDISRTKSGDLERRSEPLANSLRLYTSIQSDKNRRHSQVAGNIRMRKRSLSIPAMGKHGSVFNGPILSGAPKS